MKLLVDGQPVNVRNSVVVVFENLNGPVDHAASDQLHMVCTPDNNIKLNVHTLNAVGNPGTTGATTSTTTITAQSLASTTH